MLEEFGMYLFGSEQKLDCGMDCRGSKWLKTGTSGVVQKR